MKPQYTGDRGHLNMPGARSLVAREHTKPNEAWAHVHTCIDCEALIRKAEDELIASPVVQRLVAAVNAAHWRRGEEEWGCYSPAKLRGTGGDPEMDAHVQSCSFCRTHVPITTRRLRAPKGMVSAPVDSAPRDLPRNHHIEQS